MFELVMPLLILLGLVFFPFVAGVFFLPSYLSFSIRWYFGLTLLGLFTLFTHALGASQTLVWGFLGMFLLAASVFLFAKTNLFTDECELDCPSTLWIQISAWAALIFVVLTHPLTPYFWDALYIWYNKARALFYWAPLSETPGKDLFMVNYPHLGPVLQMMLMKLAGKPWEEYGRMLFPTLYIVWSLSVINWIRRIHHHHAYHLLGIAVLWACFLQTHFINGYQDAFVSLTAGMATLCFLNSMIQEQSEEKVISYFYLGVYFSGACCFIKTEGFALGGGALSAYTLVNFFRRSPLKAHHFLSGWGIFFTLFICWPFLLSINGIDPSKLQAEAFSLKELPLFFENLSNRWPTIQNYYRNYFIYFVNPFTSMLILSIWGFLRAPHLRAKLIYLWLILIGHMTFVAIPFIMTHLPLEWHLSTAFGRLMFQHSFLYPLILLLCGSGILKKISRKEEVF